MKLSSSENTRQAWRSTALVVVLAAALLGVASSAFAQAGGGGGGARIGGGGLGGGGAIGGGGGGGGGSSGANANRTYQNSTMVGDATITSDIETRRIIVVTDDDTNENIKKVIANLDAPKPQVLINVVFLQVTHENDLDLGMEASYTGPIAIKTNPTGTATTKFGVAGQLADASSSTAYGAFYKLTGRDIEATIHALATTNKVEVLSRPSVLTRSNQQATILVGQNVPTITGSQIAQSTGTVTNLITYRNVGVILRVTPYITNEGYVEMILQPEISAISATTVPIGNGINSPVIDTRAADTVVVTKSDRTVVIGGLLSDSKNDVDSKVPLLGDIPIIGAAFRRQNHSHVKSELLIFLTPHVVKTPDDLDQISQSEQQRLNLAPNTFDKSDVDKFLPRQKN
jgi:general secretion pathway protein D